MPYIVSLDVGSTTIRSVIYDEQARVVARADQQTATMGEGTERCEVDEEGVLHQVVSVVKEALCQGNLKVTDISCMGITTQRNTFITWNSATGEVYHHLISWRDSRCDRVAQRVNQSFLLRLIRGISKLGHMLTGSGRLLTASLFKFNIACAAIKLKWVMETNDKLRKDLRDPKIKNNVKFGTLDTWLLWRLTKGQVYATDFSMASSTSLFDPYTMTWSSLICTILGIPTHILPPIHETSSPHAFTTTHPSYFGAPIPITAMVADQQASVFGQCCFEQGEVKCTLGTGTFVDCNTGECPSAGGPAHYPLVGWKYGDECRFLVESYSSNTASTVLWCCTAGLSKNVQELSSLAFSTLPPSILSSSSLPPSSLSSPPSSTSPSSSSCLEDGYFTKPLCFVGSFNGLQVPKNDYNSGPLLIGLTEKTTSNQIVRSALNFIVFLFYWMTTELKKNFKNFQWDEIKCDGGVSNNDYILTTASHLLQCDIYRPSNTDSTSLGCAYLAGLAAGIWKDKEELKNLNNKNNKNVIHINNKNNKEYNNNQKNEAPAENNNNNDNNNNNNNTNDNININNNNDNNNINNNNIDSNNNNNNSNNNNNNNKSKRFKVTSDQLTFQLQHEFKHFMRAVQRSALWYQ